MTPEIICIGFIDFFDKLGIKLSHLQFKTWEDGQKFAKVVKPESAGKEDAGVITINDVLFSWPPRKAINTKSNEGKKIVRRLKAEMAMRETKKSHGKPNQLAGLGGKPWQQP